MSEYIQYINFPSVPEELLDTVDFILTQTPEASYKFTEDGNPFYEAYPVSSELQEWVINTFPQFIITSVIYQVIYSSIPIHKDASDTSIGLNYLLQSGGDTVYTSVYDEDKETVLQSECIREREWHKIKVNNFHGVHGIPEGNIRFSLRFSVAEPHHNYYDIA